MDIQGIGGYSATNFLTDSNASVNAARSQSEMGRFEDLLKSMTAKEKGTAEKNAPSVASSQINRTNRLTGDYTQGFSGAYTSEKDKAAKPQGVAANSKTGKGKTPVIDKTSELYEQSLELENYMVKMMLSSARKTVMKSSLSGEGNSYARDMYEDMLYDNYAEALTKNAGFGLADQIYIELSGQK
ncbi:MAG: rod-binding protein [Treponema sp.]|nr:rod-binding protein [Treponema sp.]